ncbi:RICIN domain-containing protein [Hymenobacter perfusus]|uniref:T9SS C-terminal target domain-containing protein n=1 Tax=Hymenobacter perfusus TaxID=1236770 RepID=A0A3R9P192_9BACT|nr:RICIN domain-containing protein [Hymenobacter perfusus]RSK46458.1 T9SS C-terminal target domain-containing protein [Hymenobacter perfusus]
MCSVLGLSLTGELQATGVSAAATELFPARPVASLPVQGWGMGLTASYFNNGSLAGAPVLKRQDAVVDFRWGAAAPAPELPVDNFSVRWEGLLAAPGTGRYRFVAATTDEVRLWVNGKKVLDTWDGRKPTNVDDPTVTLAAGEKVTIKLEYNDAEGNAGIQLQWAGPGQSPQLIPTGNLYPLGSPLTRDPAGPPPVAKAKAVPTPTAAGIAAKSAATTAAKPAAAAKPVAKPAAVPAKPAPKAVAQAAPKAAEKVVKAPKPPKPVKEAEPEPTPPADLSGLYTLSVRSTGQPLKVEQSRPATRAEQLAAEAAGQKDVAPQWRIEPAGEGLYRLVLPGSNKVLEVLGSSTSNGAPLSVWTYYSGYNQRWKIEEADKGYYKLTPHHVRKKVLTYGDTLDGGLQQQRYTGEPNQQWKLVAVKEVEEKMPAAAANAPSVGDNKMSVYPNPSNGVLQMAYTLPEAKPLGWVLYNQNGVAVRVSDYRKQPAGAHHQTLDFTALPAGDYYLSLTVGITNTRQLISIRRPGPDAPAPSPSVGTTTPGK